MSSRYPMAPTRRARSGTAPTGGPAAGDIADKPPPPAEELKFRLGYRPELDGVRTIAIVLVMFTHSFWVTPAALHLPIQGMFQGVDIFFVLSGFLLTSLLLEERARNGKVSIKGFYQRRALRLLPSLFFLLACHLIFVLIVGWSLVEEFQSIAAIVGYVANYVSAFTDQAIPIRDLDQTWSLAVEEQYYLVFFPTLLLVLHLTRRRYLIVIGWLLSLAALAFVLRYNLIESRGATRQTLAMAYMRTEMRLDALVVGPLVAIALYAGIRMNRLLRLLALGGVVFAVVLMFQGGLGSEWVFRWGLTPLAFGWGFALLWLVKTPPNFVHAVLRTAPMVWVGRISYELYLWHMPTYLAVAKVWGQGAWPMVAAVAISFAGATFSYYVVARPFREIRRRQGADLRGESVTLRPT